MKIYITIFLIILSDILTKYWTNIYTPNIPIIGDWIKIVFFKNTGIAFSIPLPGISIIIPLILSGLLIFILYSWKKLSEHEKIGYTMILTWGLLNALERSFFGAVTDMIYFKYFAVFNIADIAVTSGVVLLFIGSILSRKNNT